MILLQGVVDWPRPAPARVDPCETLNGQLFIPNSRPAAFLKEASASWKTRVGSGLSAIEGPR